MGEINGYFYHANYYIRCGRAAVYGNHKRMAAMVRRYSGKQSDVWRGSYYAVSSGGKKVFYIYNLLLCAGGDSFGTAESGGGIFVLI